MKKVLLLATGGTITSQAGKRGLLPYEEPPELISTLDDFRKCYDITSRAILNLDSSNIQCEEWQMIAKEVYDELPNYDGIVITHGTDTMAYTASMLSYMLQNLDKPVVLTGSQIPIGSTLSDARSNLATALAAINHNVIGVSIAFNHKLISGCRAVKVRTMGFDAFESVNYPNAGEFFADGVRLLSNRVKPKQGGCILKANLCSDVFLLKLVPGTNPEILNCLKNMGYCGVVIESFGAGGMPYTRRDISGHIKKLVDSGISVVVCSQCLYEHSDFSIYEVGRRVLTTGAIQGIDMTTEAAVTKLMWALGQTTNQNEIRSIFETNYVGEINIQI